MVVHSPWVDLWHTLRVVGSCEYKVWIYYSKDLLIGKK